MNVRHPGDMSVFQCTVLKFWHRICKTMRTVPKWSELHLVETGLWCSAHYVLGNLIVYRMGCRCQEGVSVGADMVPSIHSVVLSPWCRYFYSAMWDATGKRYKRYQSCIGFCYEWVWYIKRFCHIVWNLTVLRCEHSVSSHHRIITIAQSSFVLSLLDD